ncbi:MAG: hypothetical protein WAN18_07440, partial [Candidatus Sulfotelmatobacter sp.]
PGNSRYAILSCPRCGHVEFVLDSSPLLQSLELVTIDAGDGDYTGRAKARQLGLAVIKVGTGASRFGVSCPQDRRPWDIRWN